MSASPRFGRPWGSAPTARLAGRLLAAGLVMIPTYALSAYLILPAAWMRYQSLLPSRDELRITRTAEGIPGDPLNVALVGRREEVVAAMRAAGWVEADRITLSSGLRDAGSVLFDRPYRNAPMSTQFLWRRPQDLAFEQIVGGSPRRRHHVRLWRSAEGEDGGRRLWIGAATYDRSVGLSRFTGEVMHHIDPDVDAERGKLFADLTRAGRLRRFEIVGRFRPAGAGENGGGDRYETDGKLYLGVLAKPGS